MPELIDKNALQEALREEYDRHKALYDEIGHIERGGIVQGLSYAKMILCKQPTIDAEPVRRGRWIEKPPYADETVKGLEFQIVCSRCDEQNSSITFDENSVPIAKTFYRTRYCPNCGARMDGGAENG